MKFEKQLELAQALIGKTVQTDVDEIWKVENVCVVLEGDEYADYEGTEGDIEEQGWCIAIEDGEFICSHKLAKVIPIKVNGYTAKEDGDCIEFGCAKIDKKLLAQAKELLERSACSGNRASKSVKIGDGEFDLETLRALEERFGLSY